MGSIHSLPLARKEEAFTAPVTAIEAGLAGGACEAALVPHHSIGQRLVPLGPKGIARAEAGPGIPVDADFKRLAPIVLAPGRTFRERTVDFADLALQKGIGASGGRTS